MSQMTDLVDLVRNAINNGAKSVEDVHKMIAKQPFEVLRKFVPPGSQLDKVEEFQNQTIGNVYEAIRNVNQKAGEIAKDLLNKVAPDQAAPK